MYDVKEEALLNVSLILLVLYDELFRINIRRLGNEDGSPSVKIVCAYRDHVAFCLLMLN